MRKPEGDIEMEPEPSEISKTGRRCPRCDAHEPNASVRNCQSCGQLLSELLRHSRCPSCGAADEERDICRRCGTSLIIGPPLAECFPQKPFSDGVRPVLLLEQSSSVPRELANAPAGRFEELEASAPANVKLSGMILTVDPEQMSGVPQDHVKLAVGESVTVYARGQDADGKWCPLPAGLSVKWRADRELELEPKTGETVTARLIREPKVSAMATARTVVDKKRLQRLFTVEVK
jgi:hypothetical protein